MERMEYFFDANGISEASKKRSFFLSVCGTKTYKLIKILCLPASPTNKPYSELVDMMTRLQTPNPMSVADRFKFHGRKQKPDETIGDYLKSLKIHAQGCEFGSYLEQSLRDQFVYGLKSSRIQKELLATSRLSLKTAIEMALSMERADAEISDDQRNVTSSYSSSHQVRYVNYNDGWNRNSGHRSHVNSGGNRNYAADGRYLKRVRCYQCHKLGHKSESCPSRDRKEDNDGNGKQRGTRNDSKDIRQRWPSTHKSGRWAANDRSAKDSGGHKGKATGQILEDDRADDEEEELALHSANVDDSDDMAGRTAEMNEKIQGAESDHLDHHHHHHHHHGHLGPPPSESPEEINEPRSSTPEDDSLQQLEHQMSTTFQDAINATALRDWNILVAQEEKSSDETGKSSKCSFETDVTNYIRKEVDPGVEIDSFQSDKCSMLNDAKEAELQWPSKINSRMLKDNDEFWTDNSQGQKDQPQTLEYKQEQDEDLNLKPKNLDKFDEKLNQPLEVERKEQEAQSVLPFLINIPPSMACSSSMPKEDLSQDMDSPLQKALQTMVPPPVIMTHTETTSTATERIQRSKSGLRPYVEDILEEEEEEENSGSANDKMSRLKQPQEKPDEQDWHEDDTTLAPTKKRI